MAETQKPLSQGLKEDSAERRQTLPSQGSVPHLVLGHFFFPGEAFIQCFYCLWFWLPGIKAFRVDWGACGRQPLPLPLLLLSPEESYASPGLPPCRRLLSRRFRNCLQGEVWRKQVSDTPSSCTHHSGSLGAPTGLLLPCYRPMWAEDADKAARTSRNTGNTHKCTHP